MLSDLGQLTNLLDVSDPGNVHSFGLGVDHDGGYAEFIVMPARSLFRLPDEIPALPLFTDRHSPRQFFLATDAAF